MTRENTYKEALDDLRQKPIMDRMKESVKSNDFDELLRAFSLLRIRELDITDISHLDRLIKKNHGRIMENAKGADLKKIKVAVLGKYNFDTLISAIRVSLMAKGFIPEIYQSGYGLMEQEIIDPKSDFYGFKPDIALLVTGYRDVKEFPEHGADPATVNKMVDREAAKYASLWKTITDRMPCHILQNNIDIPVERPFGELEAKYPWAKTNYLRRINLKLGELAPGYVSILDIDHLSSKIGKRLWFDERFYYHSKDGFAFDCMPEYADLFALLVSAVKGASKKCLVLDLDNTLWGGAIGDEGIENIRFGQGSGDGEAYLEFARYIDALRRRGVVLAVCSKNDEETAREPFLKLEEMPIKLEDISVFMANWDDKATNIKRIAQKLNIGLDYLVFVDNDPIERELVKRFLPMVSVTELPDDPSLYKRALYDGHYFEMTEFSKEDRERSKYYRAQEGFDAEKEGAPDIATFLQSLNMKLTVSAFNDIDLGRITQLVNKTNQFNLTTRRYSEAEIRSVMKDSEYVTVSARLKDKFGDHGLISVFIGRIAEGSILEIDTWVMSCRVFSRKVEDNLFDHVLNVIRRRGISFVRGAYIPTKKNAIVKDLYSNFDFILRETEKNGTTHWELDLNTLRKTYGKMEVNS